MPFTCSVCHTFGHTKRNKNCPGKQMQDPIQNTPHLQIYKKPVIVYDNIASQYYSILDQTVLHPNIISICIKNNIARWCYTLGNNKYVVCSENTERPHDTPNNIYLFKLALCIPRPTAAIMSILLWQFIYIPENNLDIVRKSSCECPICYETFHSNKLIQINCSHSFCIPCVQGYIKSIQTTEQLPVCPMCRQGIHTLSIYDVTNYNTLADTLYKL